MVVVDSLPPDLTHGQEVGDVGGLFHPGCLQVDGVEVAQEEVVSQCHFGRDAEGVGGDLNVELGF